MKAYRVNPVDYWTASLQLGLLAVETQAVMAMRLWGMAGLWNVTGTENSVMVNEKPGALIDSAMSAVAAGLRGAPPDQIMLSAIRPLRNKTRSNSRRLAKRGPKFY
ncbi:antifreeze protein [Roseivivax sp. CAU 1761]